MVYYYIFFLCLNLYSYTDYTNFSDTHTVIKDAGVLTQQGTDQGFLSIGWGTCIITFVIVQENVIISIIIGHQNTTKFTGSLLWY